MKNSVLTAVTLILIGYATPSRSEQWTIDRAVRTAVAASTAAATEELSSSGAALDAESTAKKWYPALSIETSAKIVSEVMEISLPFKTVRFGDYDSYDFTVGVNQLLYDGGRLAALREASLKRARMSGLRSQAEKLTAAFKAKNLFYTVAMTDKSLEAASLSVDQAAAHLHDVIARKAQGMALEADVLKSRLRVSQAEMEKESRMNVCEKARSAFREVLGLPAGAPVEILAEEEAQTPIPETVSLAIARTHRPEFRAFEAALVSYDRMSDAAKADRKPTLGLSGSFHYGQPGLNLPENNWMHYFSGGLVLRWNILDWGESERSSAKALIEKKRTEHAITDFERRLNRELTDAESMLKTATRRYELARESSVFAEKQLALTSSSYREGMATETDYDIAHTAYTQSLFDLSSAAFAVKTAETTIEYILGLSYTGGEQ